MFIAVLLHHAGLRVAAEACEEAAALVTLALEELPPAAGGDAEGERDYTDPLPWGDRMLSWRLRVLMRATMLYAAAGDEEAAGRAAERAVAVIDEMEREQAGEERELWDDPLEHPRLRVQLAAATGDHAAVAAHIEAATRDVLERHEVMPASYRLILWTAAVEGYAPRLDDGEEATRAVEAAMTAVVELIEEGHAIDSSIDMTRLPPALLRLGHTDLAERVSGLRWSDLLNHGDRSSEQLARLASLLSRTDPERARRLVQRLEADLRETPRGEGGIFGKPDVIEHPDEVAWPLALAYAALGDEGMSSTYRAQVDEAWDEFDDLYVYYPERLPSVRQAAFAAARSVTTRDQAELRDSLQQARELAAGEIGELFVFDFNEEAAVSVASSSVLAGDEERARAWAASLPHPQLRLAALLGVAEGLVQREWERRVKEEEGS